MIEEVSVSELSGQNLDTTVAEQVMGWYGEYHAGDQEWWTDGDGNRVRRQDDWSPSTTIADAWDVQEALREDGWRMTLVSPGGAIRGTYLSTEDPWEAIFFRPEGGREVSENGEKAPQAISRAALRVVGEDNERAP